MMRIDIRSHLMSVAFAEYLPGRDAQPTTARDGDGYITHRAPQFSMHYRPPILSVEAKLQDMDVAGIDLTVLSPAPPGPHMLGGAQADGGGPGSTMSWPPSPPPTPDASPGGVSLEMAA